MTLMTPTDPKSFPLLSNHFISYPVLPHLIPSHHTTPFLLSHCQHSGLIHNEEVRLRELEEIRNANGSHRFETKMAMSQLSSIERFGNYKGRVVG